MTTSDARKRNTEKETPMPSPTQRRHDEIIGRLDALIDAATPPRLVIPSSSTQWDADSMRRAMEEAQITTPEPVDVTGVCGNAESNVCDFPCVKPPHGDDEWHDSGRGHRWRVDDVDPDEAPKYHPAVYAVRSASYAIPHLANGERPDPLPGLPEARDLVNALGDAGWEVARFGEGAHLRAERAEAELAQVRARYEALRADVEKQRHDHARGLWPDFKGILNRDDERAKGEQR